MDQIKIGKFIAELRKEKNMTQQQLGGEIGVSFKTISKWETGKGMPDLASLKPLSDFFGITINELLSGERLKKEQHIEKIEENIINTIDYSDNKIKKTKTIYKTIILIIILFIGLLITLFCIDINRMRNNEPVFFSTWGFEYAPPINLDTEEITMAIEKYIVSKRDENKRYENEKTFVAMRTYLVEEKEDDILFYVYAWVLEESYYHENNEVKQDSGSSIPHKFVVEKINGEYVVTDSKIPRDGSYYPEDMKNIFPNSVRNDMDKVHRDGTIERLQLDIQKQVELYFHK